MFGKKKIDIDLLARIKQLEDIYSTLMLKVGSLENEFAKLQTHMSSLRGLVNRKLEFPNAKDEDLSPDGVLVKTKG